MENKFNHWLYFIPRKDVLPRKAEWIQQSVVSFDPDNCKLMTSEGDEISYEFLVVAMGLQLNYKQVFFYLKIVCKLFEVVPSFTKI